MEEYLPMPRTALTTSQRPRVISINASIKVNITMPAIPMTIDNLYNLLQLLLVSVSFELMTLKFGPDL
jgi:hypothetical protein